MRGRTRLLTGAAVTSLALVATACGGGGGDTGSAPGASQGVEGGTITWNGCTPQKALLPGSTSETCGGNVLDATEAKLVRYNVDTAAPENDIAQSIETSDNQNFTVKLKPDYKFSDGTTVKASNFVDAWNYTAYCKSGQDNNYFFVPFAGYKDLNTPECKATPKSKKLSGLKVVDDTTFTIKTSEKVSNLPIRLGYTAFAPLPDSFFADGGADTQGKVPVGAGPFMVTENTASNITMKKNPNYSGQYKPHVDQVDYRIYSDTNAAYNDLLGNNLDVLDTIPADRLVGDIYKTELPDRSGNKAVGGNTWVGFSNSDDQIKNNPELRVAISKAIDRDLIIKQIFNNSVEKADGWVPPSINGYTPNACGDKCVFDAAAAKQMFQAAGGYKGTLTMTYNANAAINKAWAEAVANSVKNTLGIDVVARGVPEFSTF